MTQEQFKFYRQIRAENEADQFTKHHATVYHRNIQSRYTRDKMKSLEYSITSQLENETSFHCEGVFIHLEQWYPFITKTDVTVSVVTIWHRCHKLITFPNLNSRIIRIAHK